MGEVLDDVDNVRALNDSVLEAHHQYFLTKKPRESSVTQLEQEAKQFATQTMMAAVEDKLAELVGKGQQMSLSNPAVINTDKGIGEDVINGISVGDEGSIKLHGFSMDETGYISYFDLENREDYTLSDLNKVLNAIKHEVKRSAMQVIRDRIVMPSARSFTAIQVEALNRYHQNVTPDTPASEVFRELLDEVAQEPVVTRKPEKWVADTAKELDDLAGGITRDHCQGLIR